MIRNLKIAYLIGLPFFIFLAVIMILIFIYGRTDLSTWIIPPVIIMAGLYFLQNPIQWMFSKKNPPPLHPKEKELLQSFSAIYLHLDEEGKKEFEEKISLFRLTRLIRMIDKKPVPEDVKLLICLPAVEMTYYDKESFKGKYQQIIVYPHPFMSPQHGDQVHITEIEHKDGVMVFSVEQLIPGLERKMFNIAAYEWAQAYLFLYDRAPIVNAIDKEEVIANLLPVIRLDFPSLKRIIGLEDIDVFAIAFSLFYDRPVLMKEHMPKSFAGLGKYLEGKIHAM